MKNQDARVVVTREMFHRAVLSLLKEKPINKVSVKELCETASLNRGTFYLHYETPLDVLKEIENQFIEENMQYFDSYWQEERKIGHMQRLFSCVFQNQERCRILMGENGDPQFMTSLRHLVQSGIIDEWQKEFPSYERGALEFLFEYVFTGSMRLILNWIDNDEGLPIQDLAQRLDRLGHYSLVAAGEFSIPVTPGDMGRL